MLAKERKKNADEAAQNIAMMHYNLNQQVTMSKRHRRLSGKTPGLGEFLAQQIQSVTAPISYSPAANVLKRKRSPADVGRERITLSDAAAQDSRHSEEMTAPRRGPETRKSTVEGFVTQAEFEELGQEIETLKGTVGDAAARDRENGEEMTVLRKELEGVKSMVEGLTTSSGLGFPRPSSSQNST